MVGSFIMELPHPWAHCGWPKARTLNAVLPLHLFLVNITGVLVLGQQHKHKAGGQQARAAGLKRKWHVPRGAHSRAKQPAARGVRVSRAMGVGAPWL
jgi:hypothetical protein